jgi:membrane-associated phospholipid phosphatase
VLTGLLIGLAIVVSIWALVLLVLAFIGQRAQAKALARLIPDLLVLCRRLTGDARVPRRAKVALALAGAYLASPIDLVPDFIPVIGQLDDAVIVGLALGMVLRGAGEDVVRELWPGPAESLALVLWSAQIERRTAHRAAAWLFAVATPLVVFCALAAQAHRQIVPGYDQHAMRWVVAHQYSSLSALADGFSRVAGAWVLTPVVLTLTLALFVARRWRHALLLALAMSFEAALDGLLKHIVGRPRPALFEVLLHKAPGFGFPSGHAMAAGAFAGALVAICWRTPWRWPVAALGFMFALGVGASRVYIGVHYPSDVVGGWLAACVLVSTLCLLVAPSAEEEPAEPAAELEKG